MVEPGRSPGPSLSASALLVLAIAAACALLIAPPASASGGERSNATVWAAMDLAGSSPAHQVADDRAAGFSLRVASGGLEPDESLYLAFDGLPSNWSRSVSGSVPTSDGYRIPGGESFHNVDIDVGDRSPAGNYTFELRVDRGLDLSTLARLVLEVELTSYAFHVTMPDLPAGELMPGSSMEATISISHDAPQREVAILSTRSAPKGWQVFVGRPMVTVEAASVGLSQVLVRLPEGTLAGEYTIGFAIDSVDPRFVPTSFLAKVNVADDPRLALLPTDQPPPPGGSGELRVDVANAGNSWITLKTVGLGGLRSAPAGWSLACDDLPVVLGPGEDSVLRLRVAMPAEGPMPSAGPFELPVTIGTDVAGCELEFIATFDVPEVRALAVAAVTPSDQAPLGDVLINPYVATNGTGYVEVRDLGNLQRYRDVSLRAAFAGPVTSVSFTRGSVQLWSNRSWVVGVEVRVLKDASPGLYRVAVTATDANGTTATCALEVRVYHLTARLEGQLWVLGSSGTDIGGAVPLGSKVTLTGTIVNDGEFAVPQATVVLFDTASDGDSVEFASFVVADIPAKGERSFTVDYDATTRGTHQIDAYLDVPGAAPAGGSSSAELPAPIRAEPAKASAGAMLLPLVLGSVVGLGAGALAILGTEAARFALMAMLAIPLYTRLRPQQVTDQFVRGQILGYVKANPGETYTSIRRALKLGNGQFVYHARVLETQGLIRSVKDGANRRFYPADMRVPTEIRDLRLNHVQRIIYSIVLEYPGISQRKIAKLVNLSPSTVSYHVNIMTKTGVIERRRSGRLMICFANGKA